MPPAKDKFTYYLADQRGGVFETDAKSIKQAYRKRDRHTALGCLIPVIVLLVLIGILL